MTECIKTLQRDGLLRNFWRKYLFAASTLLVMVLFFSCKQNVPSSGGASTEATRFDIVYELDGGKNNPENPTSYTTDKLPITLKAPTKEDKTNTKYAFVGWYTDKGHTRKIETIAKSTTGKLILYAKWNAIPIKNIAYKVIHFWQPAEGDTYVKHETETLSGKPDTDTVAVARTTYKGFHLSTVQHKDGKILQQKIKKDGSTIVKIYYDRDIFTAKFNTDGGNTIGDISGRYEAELIAPAAPTKEGKVFDKWEPDVPATFTANTEHTAIWKEPPTQQATYKVEHWTQQIKTDGKVYDASEHKSPNYALQDSEDNKRGKIGDPTSAEAKEYMGFEKPAPSAIHQETIQADGTTVVKIYYVRKDITLTFDAKGGTIDGQQTKPLTGKYGEKIEKANIGTLVKDGADFDEWTPLLPEKFPEENRNYDAQWKIVKELEIKNEPSKKEYSVGEAFDGTGLTVYVKYTKAPQRLLTETEYAKSGFDSSAAGIKTVTITYKGKSASFTVTVKAATPYEVGDIIDKDGKKYKVSKFPHTGYSPDSWEKYYVIVKVEGTKYTGVRYLDNNYGSPVLRNTARGTYQDGKPQSPDKYLTEANIGDILANAPKIKASMDKIKTISGLTAYTKENCIASNDGNNFTNADGLPVSNGSFIPFAAREFN